MIDAHIHLQDERFDTDRDILIRQAQKRGVIGFFCAATRPEDEKKVLELSQKHSHIVPFIGTHPWFADEYCAVSLRSHLKRFINAGIGEIGLDMLKGKNNQMSVFKDQFEVAALFKRPCVIHCVKAFDHIAALSKTTKELPPALLFHGFSGTVEQAMFLKRYNAFFSFSGAALFENKQKARILLSRLPIDKILIETDAPDMRPPDRFCANSSDKRNTPENLYLIASAFAAIKNMDTTSFINVINENAKRFLSGLKYE